MVATRRGTRVGSPDKNASDETSEVAEPTPSTRRTRQGTVMEENQSQSELTGDSMPDEPKDDSTAPSLPATMLKRETRRSRHHLADKKQADSTHEADVSESESCCSVVSDMQATPRTRRRAVVRDKPRTATAQDEASEAESCSSSVSATRSRRAPRSLRKRALVPTDSTPATKDDESGVESCSSVVSLSKVLDSRMITRSHSKVATAEAAASEPESCSSCVSGLQGSTVRRSARNQRVKPTEPIPLNLEESTDIPSSPVSTRLRDRRGKTKSGDEEEVYDSEGCKSGPCMSPWRSSRHQARVGESDSESVPTDVCTSQDSPSPLRGRGTPCSSRTGSASSNRAAPVTRARSKAKVTSELDTTPATVAIMPEKDDKEHEPESVPESDKEKAEDTEEQLDSTMTMGTSETQECTMIEDTVVDLTLVLDEDELDETSAGAEVEMQEPQNTEEQVTPVKGVTVSEPVEDSKVEKQTNQKETVTEMSATITEDREQTEGMVDVAVNNKKPEIVNADQAVEVQACSEPLKEDAVEVSTNDPEPAVDEKLVTDVEVDEKLVTDDEEDMRLVTDVVEDEKLVTDVEEHEKKVESEKGVIVIEGGNDDVQATLVKTSATLSDDEQPSSSSHAVSTTTEHKGMISLLDSSEDEESADEGLSADEEAGPSQADEDMESEEEITCPDESQSSQSNGLFVIDTKPGVQPDEKYYVDSKQIEEEEDEEDFVDEEGDDDDDDEDSRVLFAPKKPLTQLSSSIDPGLKMKQLGGLYISFDGGKPKTTVSSGLKTQKYQNNQDELLKNSVIVPDLEKKDSVPPYKESNNAAKLKRKAEREKTTGEGWFNMRAPELTEELKNDLKVLQMRSAMDPKRFYKKNDREGFPKYFQVGTVVDSPVDFYNSRIPKKQRKRTIVEELLADAEFRSYNKKKYQEIMVEKAAHAAGKKNKKKNKFHKKK